MKHSQMTYVGVVNTDEERRVGDDHGSQGGPIDCKQYARQKGSDVETVLVVVRHSVFVVLRC